MTDERGRLLAEYERRERTLPADLYSPTAADVLFTEQELQRAMVRALGRAGLLPLSGRRILDVGCGGGRWLAQFEHWGARREDLAGIDLVAARVEHATSRLAGADVRLGDATALPWADGSFDLALQSMMLSSVLDEDARRAAASELARVVGPSGAVLSYDFVVAKPGNRGVRALGLAELRRLFAGWDVTSRRVTPAPPLLRRLAPRSWLATELVAAARVLDTHRLVLLTRA